MVQYRVNHPGVDQVYAELRNRTQQITAMIQDLERTSQATLADWEGTAQQAYYAAKREWDSAATNMAVLLNAHSTKLNQINLNYQDGDRSAANAFG